MLSRNIAEKISVKQILLLCFMLSFSASSFSEELPNVALKVLVISPTTIMDETDPNYARGLDTIDDMLDEMGVPYDVLDASTEVLGWDKLVTKIVTDEIDEITGEPKVVEQGKYNGIILTHSTLY
ncbi:hypothetical protein, partial [Vibrio sp.]|uniref:hypothetical protein n=1 Tax=Vibrio sp. TaxID=678 RepID=UPI003D0F8DE7